MPDQIAAARRLYEAFASRDVEALRNALADDFVGEVSDGHVLTIRDGRIARLHQITDTGRWAPPNRHRTEEVPE
jgi:ketosteroid isomerase-like protein